MMHERLWYALIYVAEALIACQFFGSLFLSKGKFWSRVALYGVGYTVAYLVFAASFVWLNTVIFTLCNLVILMVGYQVTLRKAALHALLLTGLMLSTEFLGTLILGAVLRNFSQYQSDVTALLLLAVFSKLLFYLVTRLYAYIAHGRESDYFIPGPVAALLAFCCILSALVIFSLSSIYMAFGTLPYPDNIWMVCAGIGLLLVNILLFSGYQHTQQINEKYRELQLMQQKEKADEEYYTALQEQYENQRILIHDIRHHLDAIKNMLEKEEYPALSRYIGEMSRMPALQKRVKFCSDPVLNAILLHYQELSEKTGVSFTADIRAVSLKFMKSVDVTAIFGNLLENALRAAQGSEEPFVELSVGKTEKAGLLLISISNSCTEKPEVPSSLQGLKGPHGIGLRSVRRTVREYNGNMEQSWEEEQGTFRTLITFSPQKQPEVKK